MFTPGFVKFLSGLTYFILIVAMTLQLNSGPIYKLWKKETEILSESIKIKELPEKFKDASTRYPELTVCRMSGSNSPISVFGQIIPMSMQNASMTTIKQTLSQGLVLDPTYFISNLSVGVDGQDHEKHTLNVSQFFKPFLSDCTTSGFCFTADIDEIFRADGRYDSNFPLSIAITFQESLEDDSKLPTYLLYVPPMGEKLFYTGASTLGEGFKFIKVKPGESSVGTLSTTYHDKFLDCDQEDRPFSECVEEELNKNLTDCTYDAFQSGNCAPATFFSRCIALGGKKLMEYVKLSNETGCEMPCRRFVHDIDVIAKEDHWKLFPQGANLKPMSEGSSTLFLLLPKLDSLAHKQQVYNYLFPDFLGDFGGILGLFLGLSIWGLFSMLTEAFNYLQKVMGYKKSTPKKTKGGTDLFS